jgi:hypothetical protein
VDGSGLGRNAWFGGRCCNVVLLVEVALLSFVMVVSFASVSKCGHTADAHTSMDSVTLNC